MKKFACLLALCCICGMATGCNFSSSVKVESITLSESAITLQDGESKELTYTVTPADGEVIFTQSTDEKYNNFEEKVFETDRVSDGVVKITACTAGTWKFRVRAQNEHDVYAECTVTVLPPEGYAVHRGTDFKFAYPSTWTATEAQGTVVAYTDSETGTNINLIAQNKVEGILNATADDFKQTLTAQYGNTIHFASSYAGKYDSDRALRVMLEYSVDNLKFFQMQLIRNSGDKTYALTLTVPRERLDAVVDKAELALRNTVETQFRTWTPA